MNKIARLISRMVVAGMMLLLAACTDDTFSRNYDRVVEGIPVTVQLKFKASAATVDTRAAQSEASENRVDNVYILIFDENGNIKDHIFCKPGSGLTYDTGDDLLSSGKLLFQANSLNNATIVGIANLADGSTSTAYTVTEDELDAVTTLQSLKKIVMTMRDKSVYRSAFFMMTGYAKVRLDNGTVTTRVTIPALESGETATLDCTMELERTDAKVTFVVEAEASDSKMKDFSFQPTGWRVRQVPLQSFILPKDVVNTDGSWDAEGDYFDSSTYEFETFTREGSLYKGGSFVFYMPENRKAPKKRIDTEFVTDPKYAYALRDKRKQTTGDENSVILGDFEYANDHSTYVEITGLLSYFEEVNGIEQLTYANVRLVIHLGYAKQNVNDYETLRNHSYTYTVRVKGVSNIEVDVSDKEDPRPGYDGDVVVNFQKSYYFDSHYDRRLIKLNKSGFVQTSGGTTAGTLRWGVNTPFSRGVHEVVSDASQIRLEMRDYRWIKFAVNKEYGVNDNTKMVKYPGDQNYNDPFPLDTENNNQPSPYYENDYPNARLRDVNQLMAFLTEEANKTTSTIFDEKGDVYITAFVDENVYVYDPTKEQPTQDLTLWKKMAETDDRQLYIIVDDAEYSSDMTSSVIKAQYSFRQRSIRTVYNVNNADVTTGWGLESVMETKRLYAGSTTKENVTTDKDNGRKNTLRLLLGNDYEKKPKQLHWTDVLNTSDQYQLQGNYERAIYACLIRNRDLNGDNIVNADEIRWYLASINQLVDIYLGEYALDEPSRLYPRDDVDRTENGVVKLYWHYTSSSYDQTIDGNSWVLWAEEGASLGLKNDAQTYNGEYFSYRCLRNLGLPLDNPDAAYEDLIKVYQIGTTKKYQIDVSRMNEKSRRPNLETRLQAHTEREADNRPYTYFEVHSGRFGTLQHWSYYQTKDPSPTGYRIPNQRELLIMSTRLPYEAWDTSYEGYYVCQTGFSLNGEGPYQKGDRTGFMWWVHSNFMLVNEETHSGIVRPVKDITSLDIP